MTNFYVTKTGDQVIVGAGNSVYTTISTITNALNYVILTTNGVVTELETDITFNEVVPTTGFPFRLVVSDPFEIFEATAWVSTYVLTVSRREESTTNVADITSNATIVCELTNETLGNVYNGLLSSEKTISENELTAIRVARTPSVNEVTIDIGLNKVYVGVAGSPNTWEEFAPESHADLDDLATSTLHTQYYTDARAEVWHAALDGTHLATVDHDHLLVPAANIRDLDTEPADTVTGGVYYNTVSDTMYYYDGVGWKQYNTVPPHAIIFRDDGSCPDGWTEKIAWSGDFLKGGSTGEWTSGSGGSETHTHTLSTISAHAHTIPDRSVSVSTVASHYHSIGAKGAGTGDGPTRQTYNTTGLSLSTVASHTHTISVGEHDTNNGGTLGAESQSTTSRPKYVELTICEKN